MAEEPKVAEASSAEEQKRKEASSAVEPAEDAEEKGPAPAPEEPKDLVLVENAEKPAATVGLEDKEAFMRRVETEKNMWLIKAWEENEKAKVDNRAARRLADIDSWERSKVAQMEAQLKKIHEQLEMKKAARAEKLRNAAAAVRREAEEKRAAAEVRRGEEVVKAGEAAARYRDKGQAPSRIFGAGLLRRG